MIKKIILYTVALAVLLAACFWGYLWYSRWQSYNIDMPDKADRVLRLNLEQLGAKLLTGDKEQAAKEPFFAKLRGAFDIPLNVFAFGVKSVSSNVFYIKVEISDKDKFDAFTKDFLPNGTDSLRYNAARNVSLLYNAKEAVVLIGNDTGSRVFDLAKDFLNNKNTIAFSESKLYDVKKSNADLSSWGNMYNFNVNFESGKISGTFVSNIQDEVDISLKVPKSAALAFISNENIFSLLDKWGIKELLPNVNTVDLKTDAQQGFALYIDGETQQTKKVLAYEYDDDFEKIAIEKIEMAAVPNINLKFQLSSDKGLDKLKANGLLLGQDSVNSGILPLWNLKYFYKPNQTLLLYSSSQLDTVINHPILLDTEADLLAWVNFKQLMSYESFRDFTSILSKFKNLNVTHKSDELYALELNFKDEKTNAIRQLMKMFAER